MAQPEPPDGHDSAHVPNEVQRFRNRLRDELRAKTLDAADAADLLLLASCARPDGSLRRYRDGPRSWLDEKQLTAYLGWCSVKTFYSHWQRWKQDGWVEDRRPPNRGRMERRLVAERSGKP